MNESITIPSSPELESAVIGAVLNDWELFSDTELSPDHFCDPDYAKIWERFTIINKEHKTNDINTILHYFKEDVNLHGKVLFMFRNPDTFAFMENVGIIKQLSVQRAGINLFHDSIKELQKTDVDPYDLLSNVTISAMALMEDDVREDAVAGGAFMDSTFRSIQRAQDGTLEKLDTGFEPLDNFLGPILPGLIIIAARPSMGKSSFAIQLLNHLTVDKGLPGALFSLEMGADQIGRWMLAQRTQINGERMKKEGVLTEEELKDINEESYNISAAPIFIDDSAGYNILQLRSKVTRLKRRHDIKFMILDYIQLLSGVDTKGKIKNRENEVSEISRNLKLISRELNIPVFALCQMNRSIDTRSYKVPVLSDLRESGAIEQDADIVVFLHRPEEYGEQEYKAGGVTHTTGGLAVMPIRKNRDGQTGQALFHFEKQHLTFKPW